MSRAAAPKRAWPPVWQRTPAADMAGFDPASKVCTMNCGRHIDDPRSEAEFKFQCDDCAKAPGLLTAADADLLEQAIHDLVQNGETTVPAADLRRFAAMELLECTQWRVLPSAQVAIDAAREEGGAA